MRRSEYMVLPDDDDFHAWLQLFDVAATPELLEHLGDFLTDYLKEHHLTCYVLGVSGGIDSGFLAALMHHRNIPFKAFSLSIHGNAPEEVRRAEAICNAYAAADQVPPASHSLSSLYTSISDSLASVFPETSRIAEGNIKARSRMLFLYHAAQLFQGCVVSTDQLDELLTGFWTLHGDVGDISPLQVIPKSTEYALAGMLCDLLDDAAPLRAAMAATPTDGLGISSSDLDQLGVASYDELEDIFREYFALRIKATEGCFPEESAFRLQVLRQTVAVKRFESTGFKRRGPLVFNPRYS